MTLQINTELQGGKYIIKKVLGQGGFGITYLAEQTILSRYVAIKEFFFKECCGREEGTSYVTLGTQSNRETVQRFMSKFLKEARTISQLDHPNIIKIHDVFEENNTAYFVMDYIEGVNLSEMVKCQGALPEATAVEYITKVSDALAYIHARNINHLDVKPGNIMINSRDSRVVLIDFGLSKQYDQTGTQTSSTPIGISQGYAPIEQYRAGGVAQFTPQTDIYSLGATLYWLIVGETPPAADEVLSDGISLPKSISPNVRTAIEEAMKPNKNARPKSVQSFINILTQKSTSTLQSQTHDEETRIIGIPSAPSGEQHQGTLQSGVSNNNSSTKWIVILFILGVVFFFIYLLYQDSKNTSSYQTNQHEVTAKQDRTNVISSAKQESRSANVNTNRHTQEESPVYKDNHEQEIKDFITYFYSAFVWGHQFGFDTSLVSPSVLRRLRQDYEYEGDGYAFWDFRTGYQDGPSEECRITSITSEGNNWYKVTFLDMGINGVKRLKISYNNGKMRIEDFK